MCCRLHKVGFLAHFVIVPPATSAVNVRINENVLCSSLPPFPTLVFMLSAHLRDGGFGSVIRAENSDPDLGLIGQASVFSFSPFISLSCTPPFPLLLVTQRGFNKEIDLVLT